MLRRPRMPQNARMGTRKCRPPPSRRPYERPDDAAAAADFLPARARRAPPRRTRDRLAPRRRRYPPIHLQGPGHTLPPPGQGTGRPGREGPRPRGHAGLERLSPHGAVLRGQRQRRRAAHRQPAPAPGPDRLYRRPRRRPGAVLRPHLPAADPGRGEPDEDGQGLRRDDRPRAHAGGGSCSQDPQPAVLRGTARSPGRPLRLARIRREHRQLAVLHQRHHRQPQGRALQPPLHGAARLRRGDARRAEPARPATASCRWCPCSTSTPGACPTWAA